MKSKTLSRWKWELSLLNSLILISVSSSNLFAQWIGGGSTSAMIYRNGDVGIGAPASSLFSVGNGANISFEVGPAVGAIGFNRNARNGQIFNTAISAWQFTATDQSFNLELWKPAGSVPFTVLKNGNVGIGTTAPTQLLHLRNTLTSKIFLDLNWTGSGTALAGIDFGNNGTSSMEINLLQIPNCENGRLKLGPVGTTNKAIYIHSGNKIIFGNDVNFGACGKPGLTGTYMFDSQVSSASLLVATPVGPPASYPSIPSGYIASIQGNSNFNGRIQINNTVNTVPDNTITGMNMSNTTTGTVPYSWIQTNDGKPLALNPIQNSNPSINTYVAIGFTPGTYNVPADYKLAVNGRIICTELKVKYPGSWSDYVFENSYQLQNLEEVEKYIKVNKHLPDVPSANEICKEGYEAGTMDATLLRKIEELTLYMIEQKKEISALKVAIQELVTR